MMKKVVLFLIISAYSYSFFAGGLISKTQTQGSLIIPVMLDSHGKPHCMYLGEETNKKFSGFFTQSHGRKNAVRSFSRQVFGHVLLGRIKKVCTVHGAQVYLAELVPHHYYGSIDIHALTQHAQTVQHSTKVTFAEFLINSMIPQVKGVPTQLYDTRGILFPINTYTIALLQNPVFMQTLSSIF